MNRLPARLLAVTDRHQARRPLADQVSMLLEAGVRWIWLRDRDLPPGERRRIGSILATRTLQAGAMLTIGADTDLAADLGAGLHLRAGADVAAARRRLGAAALLGQSAHSVHEVRQAAAAGADYATLSPIFLSASKPSYGPALGLETLREAASFGLPVLALGGVARENAAACLSAGAAGVAVMGEAMRAANPSMIVRTFGSCLGDANLGGWVRSAW